MNNFDTLSDEALLEKVEQYIDGATNPIPGEMLMAAVGLRFGMQSPAVRLILHQMTWVAFKTNSYEESGFSYVNELKKK